MELCTVECNYCTTLCINSGKQTGIVSGRDVFTVLPTGFGACVTRTSQQCLTLCCRSKGHRLSLLSAVQPHQDPGRLLSQQRTLFGACYGLLPFGPSTINILHISCTVIGHAAIVVGCTSQCIRLYLTLLCAEVSREA